MTAPVRPGPRVLHVLRFYHPHVGGTENFVAHLAEAAVEHGVVSSVLSSNRYVNEDGPAPQVRVERLPVIGSDRLLLPYGGLRRARALVRDTQVVHAHDLRFLLEPTTVATHLRGVPLVLSSHGFIFHTQRFGRAKELAWRRYYSRLLRRCAVILCGSQQDFAACRGIGLANARLWPNPVRTEPFEQVEPAASDGRSLLYFGRIAPNKGIERLAAVLDRAPSTWTLTIAGSGDGRYVAGLRGAFGQFGARVTFTGSVSDAELPSLIARHACVVLPSTAEGFGITLVEALASGVPVVASDIPTYREIAHGSPASLVDFESSAAIVECVSATVRDWDRAAARDRAGHFSWRVRAGDLAEIYRALAHG